MKKYFTHQVKKEVIVKDLITIEALEVGRGFCYPEEIHTFYECAYIDAGTLICRTENEDVVLEQGDFLLLSPQTAHSYRAAEGADASLFILCFGSHSELLSLLGGKIALNKEQKRLVSELLTEAKSAFVFPFNSKLKPLKQPLFGAGQLVETTLEKLLIHLIRARISGNDDIVLVMNSVELENSLCNDIIVMLKEHLYATITLDEVSRQTFYSKTFLNTIFKKNTGMPIMKYFTVLKVQEAKKLLRAGSPIATVAAKLNFESATYFTKVFKKHTGITPTEYSRRGHL